MKTTWLLLALVYYCQCATAQLPGFQYVSPRPNSTLNARGTSVLLKQGSRIDRSSVSQAVLAVRGSESGTHPGTLKLADDDMTLVFKSATEYAPNETVTVSLSGDIRTVDFMSIAPASFSFTISPLTEAMTLSLRSTIDDQSFGDRAGVYQNISPMHTDSVPADLPKLTVGTSNNPADGMIFLANQSQTASKTIGNYLMIFNNDGTINEYKKISKSANGFKMEPNGSPSYNLKGSGSRIIMDTSLTPIDTMDCNIGYKTGGHDFLLLPNGHAVFMANDPQPIDMSSVVSGGNPDALVTGCVIQEVDASGNLVFQWRSFDDLPITSSYFDMTTQTVDLTHQNGLAVDREGNILVSLRHLSCIVKLDRRTGAVAWILGGKLNQFTFINEHEANAPTYFSYNHDIDVLPNGNITLFDNGTQHVPPYSRGVEYKLDERNKIATMVWDFRHSPDIYADAMGSVERLPNGNTLVGWGNKSSDGTAIATEVHPDNSIALEVFLPKGQFCYRAYKYPWVSQTPQATVIAHEVLQGNTYTFKSGKDSTGITIKFTKLSAMTYANAIVSRFPYAPVHPSFLADAPVMAPYYFTIQGQEISSYTGQVQVDLRLYPAIAQPQNTIMYVRPQFSELFTPVPTSWDSARNQLVVMASDFGDYAFGVMGTYSASAPLPISPKNNEWVNGTAPVRLLWGTRGLVQRYRLQVSVDSTFNSLVFENSAIATSGYTLPALENNKTYYWRVNTMNSWEISDWSAPAAFTTASPFITVTFPNGGERMTADSTYIIRWQSNVHDTMWVSLMKGGAPISVIADSLVSGTNALLWSVPVGIGNDTSYSIRVTSLNHAGLADASDRAFTIMGGVTAVAGQHNSADCFRLDQNFPNPFNPTTVIGYSVPVSGRVTFSLYDILGREVRALVDARQEAGAYTITLDANDLPGGVYIYRLQAGSFVQSKKLLLLK
jgi:hypothetical protein